MLKTQSLFLLLFLQYFTFTAQINATYGFINVGAGSGTEDPGPWPVVSGLACRPFKAVGVASQPSANGRFAFNNWSLGATNGVDDELQMTGALSGLSYYEVRLLCQPGYTFSLTAIRFHVRRSSTGCRHFTVRSSADDFSNGLSASTGTNQIISVRPGNYFFWKYDSVSTSADQKGCIVYPALQFSDSLSFRFYAWNAESSGGSFSLDNVTFSGFFLNDNPALNTEKLAITESKIRYRRENREYFLSDFSAADWYLYDLGGQLIKVEKGTTCFSAGDAPFFLMRCVQEGRVIYQKKKMKYD